MSTQANFSCTALAGTNKAGALTSDKNGYYEMVLGAYNFNNSAGATYPYNSAKHLFKQSSSLMRRINNGQCRSECGHPKKLPGQSMQEYLQRILSIEETNVCAHIKSVRIDTSSVKDEHGKNVIAVLGMVKPSGPKGEFLKESMENADENVAFSVRSLTQDSFESGQRIKHMKELITWDYVNEPGISIATKYHAPALEDIGDNMIIVPQMLDSAIAYTNNMPVGMESVITPIMVKSSLGWQKVETLSAPSRLW